MCCSEAYNKLIKEDMNCMKVKDAWYSPRMLETRKRHLENNLKGTQCYKCVNGVSSDEVRPLNEELYLQSLQDRS